LPTLWDLAPAWHDQAEMVLMSRRELLQAAALLATPAAVAPGARLEIPVLRLLDRNSKCSPGQMRTFFSEVWDEALRDFAKGGISFRIVDRKGEVLKYPSGKPRFRCLDRGVINIVLADRVPLDWDKGRSLAGVATLYEGFCVCVISMKEAHENQVPFVAVNTVVHELLHILMQDVFVMDRVSVRGISSEARVDMYASRLWLFGDGETIRRSARECLKRLPGNAPRLRDGEPCPSM
jgi:hypothetical protein